jgi:hypothetical protein
MDFARYDRSGLNQTRWHGTIDRLALIGRSPTDICASVIYMLALGEIGRHVCLLPRKFRHV